MGNTRDRKIYGRVVRDMALVRLELTGDIVNYDFLLEEELPDKLCDSINGVVTEFRTDRDVGNLVEILGLLFELAKVINVEPETLIERLQADEVNLGTFSKRIYVEATSEIMPESD